MNRRTAMTLMTGVVTLSGCAGFGTSRLDEQGDIRVVIDGSEFDLSKEKFQAENAENESLAFHLHEGDDKWYMEGREAVTFGEGLDALPHFAYEQTDGADVLTIDGATYDERDAGTTITFSANGEEVDPTTYDLQDGDDLRVEITT